MNDYYAAYDNIDLKCYPNYSFEIGDVDGDGRMEFIAMDQSGNLLRVLDLEGRLLFEKKLKNNGNWGTPLICAADIDNDGRSEIIVPCGKSVAAFDKNGKKIREHVFDSSQKDDFGINIPLLGAAKILSPNEPSVIAAAAGGNIAALDGNFDVIWQRGGLRNQFGHEIHFADIDGDGLDEIAFCSVDNIGGGGDGSNTGELVLLDHDGTVMLRKRVDDYIADTHFDDIAMADFLGDGSAQILVEKGVLLDLEGGVIWDLSGEMVHGQWIAHTANSKGKGKTCFISELWGNAKKSMLFSGQGQKIMDIGGFCWPRHTEKAIFVPTRCHMVQWDKNGEPEIFFTQQAVMGGHACTETYNFQLNALFLDSEGNLVGEMPFDDAQIEGYYYNGEVHSKAADIDGDGRQEVAFTKQDGHVMVIKKKG
ncbi:MAG: FG-GAP-like repeat-containing protein [Oscillospiraceae bacterium]|nr:FG-GAP-like repeat-containing protein [Oscillospiraceae bacterium]